MDRKQQTKKIASHTVIKNALMIAGVTFAFSTQVQAQSWTLTPQSNVGFEIKSLGVTVVRAKFNRVQSSMQFDAKAPQYASTNFVMDVNDFQMDAYDESLLPNKAHQIIYKHVYELLTSLQERKEQYKNESELMYKTAYDAYKQ